MKTNSKRVPRKSRRPMVPTTDTIDCPQKGVINVHAVNPNDALCPMPTEADYAKDKRKAEMQAMFVRDGLCPEERLLRAIFGESPKGLPPKFRTQGEFKRQYKETLKQFRRIERDEAYIHGGRKYVHVNEKAAAMAKRLIKGGMSVAAAAKEVGVNAYSLKFRLSDDYNKPNILLLGEAQLREAKRTKNERLMKKALRNIASGKKVQEVSAKLKAEQDAEEKAVRAKIRAICRENGIRRSYEDNSEEHTLPGFRRLAKAGKLRPGALVIVTKDEYTSAFREYLYTGKDFVLVHQTPNREF